MPPAGCGSTPLLAICRTSRWTTSTRQAGALPDISGSCVTSGSTWRSRRSMTTTWSSRPGAAAPRVSRPADVCRSSVTVAAESKSTASGSIWGPTHGRRDSMGFDLYEQAADGRVVSTKLELAAPSGGAQRRPWPLRRTDIDLQGHVNNAAYWHAVEDVLSDAGPGRGKAVPCAARASARARSRRRGRARDRIERRAACRRLRGRQGRQGSRVRRAGLVAARRSTGVDLERWLWGIALGARCGVPLQVADADPLAREHRVQANRLPRLVRGSVRGLRGNEHDGTGTDFASLVSEPHRRATFVDHGCVCKGSARRAR